MRRSRIIIGLGLALGVGPAVTGARAEGPTYHKDVAAILQANCQECHRPGQVAPFALLTYEQARKRAADIVQVTGERVMPPWPASTSFGGPFRDERVLADAEVETLRKWMEAGSPEGDPEDAPPPKVFASDWPLGEPDLVLTMGEAYELAASGDDEFRVFVLPTSLPEDRWIRAVDFKPGNRRVVHHVLAGVARDKEGRARELDAKDPKPGYSSPGGFGDGVQVPGFLPIWTPGSRPRSTPEGSGYHLPAGADVLIQVHYHKSGKVETDATTIGLYLSETPLPRRVQTGFLFPSPSPLALAKLMVKAKLAQNAGRRPSLNELMRDVLIDPPGRGELHGQGLVPRGQGRRRRRPSLVARHPADLGHAAHALAGQGLHVHGRPARRGGDPHPPDPDRPLELQLAGDLRLRRADPAAQGGLAGDGGPLRQHGREPRQPALAAEGRLVGRSDHRRDVHRHLRIRRRR